MFGIDKKKKAKPIDKEALTTAFNIAYDNYENVDSSDELMAETGKSYQQILDAVLSDDEVISCREDLLSAIRAKKWRIWGDDVAEEDINRLYKNIQSLINDFSLLSVVTVFGGYAVAEYEFKRESDGFYTLNRVLSKYGELDKYQPQRDGSLSVELEGDKTFYNADIDPRFDYLGLKYLVLTNNAVPSRPKGEMLAIRAYPAVAMRKRGWAYAGQFIARHAQPYIVGKQANDINSKESFTTKIFRFLSGGAIGVGKDDAIEIHQLTGNGEAFDSLEKQANRRIQKLFVGLVKTSETANGSRASQQEDGKVRTDRVDAYLNVMTIAIQHAIDAIVLANNQWGKPINAPQGVWFDYPEVKNISLEQANIFKTFADVNGFEWTDAYLLSLGLEEGHFKMVGKSTGEPPVAKLSDSPYANNQSFSLSMPCSMSLSSNYQLSDKSKSTPSNSPLAGGGIEAKKKAEQKKHEQLMQPKIAALLSACDGSDNWDSFGEKLDGLEFDNTDLIDDLTVELADSFVDGVTGGRK